MARQSGKLEGRAAIVTGAASGIGLATAVRLAAEGAWVLVADLDAAGAARVASDISAAGGRAAPQEVDVGDEDSIAAMVSAAVERFGRLDVLHNNAAATSPEVMGRDLGLLEMDAEVWDRTLAVNLRGPMLACKHALPHMLRAASGVIVNTSSVSGLVGDLSRAAYGASKAGLDGLTRYVATQFGKQGIRCNAIAPGVVETPALAANVPPDHIAIFERSHLTPRLGKPEDIAAAVAFLASDDAAFITGQVLCVDGGLLAHHPSFAEFQRTAG